jgi:nifR3 family TIM-barrel protein
MKIGSVVLENNIFLAPMAGVTDMPFRILCREQGCGLVYTEMVSAKGMHYNDEKSAKLTEISEIERPASVQIFGSDPEIMEGITRKLDFSDASIIDINMGCPTPKITKNGEGSALMLKPRLVGDIVKSVSQATHKPVTVKIRKGWDESSVNAVEIARIAEENGAKAIAVHGRTREQLYSGSADWEIIARVKEAVSVPVIGNGDVRSPGDAERMLRQTGCDAVMVGRGAQGNPWIFRRILTYLENGALTPEPSNIEKIDMIIRHMKMLVELKGEHTGVLEMRKHIAWYIKGMRNSTYVKEKVFKLYDVDEIVQLLLEYLLQN